MGNSLLIEVTGMDGTTRVVTPMELEAIVTPPAEGYAEQRDGRILRVLSSSWLWIGVGLLALVGLTRSQPFG